MATPGIALICPQGHGAGVSGAQFCTSCGVRLVDGATPGPTAAAPLEPQPVAASTPQPVAIAAAIAQPAPAETSPAMPAAEWQPVAVQGQAVAVAVPQPLAQANPETHAEAPPAPINIPATKSCKLCGGSGVGLNAAEDVCPECAWLRPLLPGYRIDRSVFLWKQDGQAMAKLQSLPALHAAVRAVSDKVGRPWIESTFNAVRLGPRQLPDVWKQAVLAARILGLPSMPDVYISGDQMWNTYTYGTENSFFVVLGTSHLINFSNDELLFVLAREMGHCRAGHALWKTVTRFIAGDTSVHHGLLSDGLINAISPSKLIHGALDLPLMAWARQSEISADRAGLLAVGDEALARRVLLAWSIRSARLLQQLNIDEWMKQEAASDDQMTRISEMTTSSSMYTTRRLRLLHDAAQEKELMRWSQTIQPVRRKLAPVSTQMPGLGVGTVRSQKTAPAAPHKTAGANDPLGPPAGATHSGPHARIAAAGLSKESGAAAGTPAAPAGSIRVVCNKCQTAMQVPLSVLRGKTMLNVRCPQCKSVFVIRAKGPGIATGAHGAPVAAPATEAKPAVNATAALPAMR